MSRLWKRLVDYHPSLLNHIDFSHPIFKDNNANVANLYTRELSIQHLAIVVNIIKRAGSRLHDLSLWSHHNNDIFDTVCNTIKSIIRNEVAVNGVESRELSLVTIPLIQLNRIILFGHQKLIPGSYLMEVLEALKPKIIHFATCFVKFRYQLANVTSIQFGVTGRVSNNNIQLQLPLASHGSYKCKSCLKEDKDIHRTCPICYYKFCIECVWNKWNWSNQFIKNCTCCDKTCKCSLCKQLDRLREEKERGHISYYVSNYKNVDNNINANNERIVINPYSCVIHCKNCINNKSFSTLNVALCY